MLLHLARRFHTGAVCFTLESSLLAKLRKKTGYTIANCKKALELHNNDCDKAESWLHDQAQAMGWAKATKLAGRSALQGLIAVKYDKSHGALVELNCETDFVAKNEKFQQIIEEAALACFHYAHTQLKANGPITKMELDSDQLGNLNLQNGKKLSEILALFIGAVGENAVLRRAECWKAKDDINITAYSHPSFNDTDKTFSSGKYGALLAYRQKEGKEDIGKQICQHIVGCGPRTVGDADKDKPAKNVDDETCLIFQEYLLDPEYTVDEILKQHELEIVDFIRFSCGEPAELNLPGVEKQPLETVQTLQ